jgi:uncharacterized membrane protein
MADSRQSFTSSNKQTEHKLTAIPIISRKQYIAPLPPADEFAKYDKTIKGGANRILTMAEIDLDSSVKNRKITSITLFLATVLYYLITLLLVVATIILGLNNQPIIAIGTSITALATASPKIIEAIRKPAQ